MSFSSRVRLFMNSVRIVFVSYVKAELLRSKGFLLGLISMAIWLAVFMLPMTLFRDPETPASLISTYMFVGIAIFQAYSVSTWDWGWELRYSLFGGVLENVIVSGSSILVMYVGIIPISISWLALSLSITYVMLSAIIAPPILQVTNPALFLLGLVSLMIVLFAYAMILGSTLIASGTSGAIVEFVSWILPIATGGITPLANLPHIMKLIALLTPFSYPAELLRHSLGLATLIMPEEIMIIISILYPVVFLAFSYFYFKKQLRKLLKEGIKTVSLW
ncbi:MAG: ABC transporter permease [Desulfurococcaceae archaeon TW002]